MAKSVVFKQAIKRLREAGFNVTDNGVVTSPDRGRKAGTVLIEDGYYVGSSNRVHPSKRSGKPSGAFVAAIRGALGELGI